MTNTIDRIVKEAEERLNRFYKAYGEDIPKEDKSKKLEKPSSPGKIIYRPIHSEDLTSNPPPFIFHSLTETKPNLKKEIQRPKKDIKKDEVSFENLTSREIITLVKNLTGITINICVKSKKNVIRHATNILKEKGFPIKN